MMMVVMNDSLPWLSGSDQNFVEFSQVIFPHSSHQCSSHQTPSPPAPPGASPPPPPPVVSWLEVRRL